MLDSVPFLIASYAAMSAGMSLAVRKVSPAMGPRLRHLFAGAAPLAVLLAIRLEGGPSTTLDALDLFGAGGLLVLGVATSSVVGKFFPTRGVGDNKLPSR
ncbi:hypothetical protein [Qipengyuania seohaensis]|uniref:hypothetical protein n=1 Tax=Qipengyuania seohaensis TaxID=266951 RepID=UPI0012FE4244|nr:hypothetical protein [Qipengyuania seohaensis]